MIYHIVKLNETIEQIATMYSISVDELISSNKQIKNIKTLIPGMKLKIMELTENLNNEIDNVEPFIEEYYPPIEEVIKNIYEEKEPKEEIKEEPVQKKVLINQQMVVPDINEFKGQDYYSYGCFEQRIIKK